MSILLRLPNAVHLSHRPRVGVRSWFGNSRILFLSSLAIHIGAKVGMPRQ